MGSLVTPIVLDIKAAVVIAAHSCFWKMKVWNEAKGEDDGSGEDDASKAVSRSKRESTGTAPVLWSWSRSYGRSRVVRCCVSFFGRCWMLAFRMLGFR